MKQEVSQTESGGGAPAAPPEGYKLISYGCGWDPATVDAVAPNIRYAASLGLPQFEIPMFTKPDGGKLPVIRGGKCIIVGSGPSVLEHLDKIRDLKKDKRNTLWVVNKSYRLMLDNDIIPDAHCLMEIGPRQYDCLDDPLPTMKYYVASLCDKACFDALRGMKVTVFHVYSEHWEHIKALNEGFGKIDKDGKCHEPMRLGGGFTTFLRTLAVTLLDGWRDYELFGVDSSFPEGTTSHYFGTPDYGGDICDCHSAVGPNGELRRFVSKPYLIRQADEFRGFCEHHHNQFKMYIHGDGLLPAIHRKLQPLMYEDYR